MGNKTVIVFGGDGFCGWPTSLGLSYEGYDVIIVDNLSRRKTDIELGADSLTPISSIDDRIATWKAVTGKVIAFENIDIAEDYNRVLTLIKEAQPAAVIQFAEQRSAPHSMRSSQHKRHTINNNINGTHNILCAIVESGLDVHVIHLGTTGVYGYGTSGMEIPEGYLNVQVNTDEGLKELEILYPPNPGSVYHLTKTQDALMFAYYNKNDGLRVTDLHQGIVWGMHTRETEMDPLLVNRFDYEGDYGTVLNRFLVQAAVGHPLTVYGTGGQTRAFINIQDTVNCIKLAIANPPNKGDRVKIFNQMTECHTVIELAQRVSRLTGAEIRYYQNPRMESAENELRFGESTFVKLGLSPVKLDDKILEEVVEIAQKYRSRCKKDKIITTSTWTKKQVIDLAGSDKPIEVKSD